MYQWLYSDNPFRAYAVFALLLFVVFFVGVCVWAYWPRHKRTLDDRAHLALTEDRHENG